MINRAIRQSLFGALLFLATGCTSFEVFNPTAMDDVEVSEDSKVVTFHGSFWGFYWSETDHIPCDENCQGLHKVVSHSNLGYALAPVLTIGLWAPSTVEYWCYVAVRDDTNANTTLPQEGRDDRGTER